jgi:hypothetical protein
MQMFFLVQRKKWNYFFPAKTYKTGCSMAMHGAILCRADLHPFQLLSRPAGRQGKAILKLVSAFIE